MFQPNPSAAVAQFYHNEPELIMNINGKDMVNITVYQQEAPSEFWVNALAKVETFKIHNSANHFEWYIFIHMKDLAPLLKHMVIAEKESIAMQQSRIEAMKPIEQSVAEETIKTYLIHDPRTGYYKIGRSRNVVLREKTLQAENPTWSVVHVIEANIEGKLHRKYAHCRMRGEWFNLSPEEVQEIKKLIK